MDWLKVLIVLLLEVSLIGSAYYIFKKWDLYLEHKMDNHILVEIKMKDGVISYGYVTYNTYTSLKSNPGYNTVFVLLAEKGSVEIPFDNVSVITRLEKLKDLIRHAF